MTSDPNSELLKVIHPPIDSVLLKSLSTFPELSDFKAIRWTSLDELFYWKIVERIREKFNDFSWKLEEHWNPALKS